MDFISGLLLILLTLVAYSSGSVLGAKNHAAVPSIFDLLVVVILWIASIASGAFLDKYPAVAVWSGIGFVLGAVFSRARLSNYPKDVVSKATSGRWSAWKNFARRLGNYQGRVLMALLYFSLVLPFALFMTLFVDPLLIKRPREETGWRQKQLPSEASIEDARRQY